MIHNIKFLSGFPTSFPHLKDKTISFSKGFDVLFGENGCGKSTILKTLAAYSGIQKGGWSSISDPMKLASRSTGHFPYVYKAYTPANLDAQVGWDGTPTFYNDSEMLNKNNFTWFFDSAVLSEDGITTGAEQLDVMAAKPSSGQYRIHKINKIMQVIQNPPNLAVVPPDICLLYTSPSPRDS